ncbi:JAB domain-containing protein [Sorangium sp. So ce362]|uniref:JAB domain-containing protein n=1 Tax=Sorangium sp. So ce362 TaxID=3133303 RepID=UPI003F630FF9
MSSAPVDAPAETAAEIPTATETALIEMVLGIPGVAPRILGAAALPSLGRLSPAALAERTQIALLDATRLAAAFELGRRTHAARARRGALLDDAARVARHVGPKLAHMAAQSFVLVHNHPSGDPTPTEVDRAMTQELRDLSHALNVPL